MLMKKISTLLAAAALAAAPAFADTLIPGTSSLTPGSADDNYRSCLPVFFDNDITNSASQSIFPADFLTQIAPKTVGTNVTTSMITAVSFVIHGGYEIYGEMQGDFTFDVWIDNVEDETFPKINSDYQWMEYDNGGHGHVTISASDLLMDEDLTITIPLDASFAYTGKNLLFTFMGSSDAYEEYGMENWFGGAYTFAPKLGHVTSGQLTGDSELTLSGTISNTLNTLPALELTYETETTQASGSPVSFANVELKLESVGVTGNSNYSKANSVSLTFDVEDPTNAGEYEIFAGAQSLGTITGTSGTIRYIPVTNNDIILRIEAEGETVATNHTVAAADINALFTEPTAEFTGEYAYYSSYDIFNEGTGTLQGAAQFQMTSTVPVTRMQVAAATPSTAQMMHTGGSYPDNIAALMPAGVTSTNYNYTYATEGKFGVYAANLGTGKLQGDVMQWPASATIAVNTLKAIYPVVSLAAPSVTAGKEALTDADEVSGTVTTVEKTVSGSINANMPVDTDHFVDNAQYPSKMRAKEDKQAKTLQFFAPKGEAIYWILEPKSRAEGSWTEAATNPYTISLENLEPGTLTVLADEPGVETPTVDSADENNTMVYTVNDDGTATSIQSIKAAANTTVEIYNLQGKRLAAPAKGINIINGKKIIF